MADAASKNRMLQDMGLSVWVNRRVYLAQSQAPGLAPAQLLPQPQVATKAATPATGLAALNELLDAEPSAQSLAQPSSALPAPAETSGATATGATAAVADFICYWGGGVLLLTDLVPFTGRDRLIKDLLAAASGDWQQRLGQAAFRWEEMAPARAQGPAAAQVLQRSVVAFVSKRLAAAKAHAILTCGAIDHLVLVACEQAVASPRLGTAEPGPKHLPVPPLAQLAADAQAKVQLWAQLVALRG